MQTTVMNPVKAFTRIALGLAIAAMGISVANADDKPVEVATPSTGDFAVDPPNVRVPGPDSRCPPLAPIRFSAAFEGAQA